MNKEEIEIEIRKILLDDDENLDIPKVFEVLEVGEVIKETGDAQNPYSRTLTRFVSTERINRIKQILEGKIGGVNLEDFSYKMLYGIDAYFTAQEMGATLGGQTVNQIYVGKKLYPSEPITKEEKDNVNEMKKNINGIKESEEKDIDEEGIVLLKLKDGKEVVIQGVTGRQVMLALGEKDYKESFYTYKKIRGIPEMQKELDKKDEQITEIKSEINDLSNKINEKNKIIERLQAMLSRTLSFAKKVRESVIGKIFFKKSIDELSIMDGELPEGMQKIDDNIPEK